MNTIATFNNVGRNYGKTTALRGMLFELKKGDCTALVGNNGCGKTTTIHILCNLIRYHGGEVYFDGKKVTPNYVSYKNKLGIVLSKPYYVEVFTPVEYLKFVCKFQYVPKNEINQRINDIIELFELENDKNKPIKILSSGNQMKVTLGAAIIHNPELLVLDEPFINIDIATTEKIMSILKGFKSKKTIFITSHNLDLVIELCDNFLIMDKGKIMQNIYKADYKNTVALKNEVKKLLVKEYKEINLSWLV
jgi:ABC-2 type transport system ATP-binding protein